MAVDEPDVVEHAPDVEQLGVEAEAALDADQGAPQGMRREGREQPRLGSRTNSVASSARLLSGIAIPAMVTARGSWPGDPSLAEAPVGSGLGAGSASAPAVRGWRAMTTAVQSWAASMAPASGPDDERGQPVPGRPEAAEQSRADARAGVQAGAGERGDAHHREPERRADHERRLRTLAPGSTTGR